MAGNGVARTLVIPMYREAARIEATVAALATSSLVSSGLQLIFVDDGSDDRTAETARACLDRFALPAQVIRLEHNMGKGAAVRAGVLEAKGRFVAFVDADLSAGVAEIDRCFRFIEAGGCEVVASTRGAPLSRIVVSQPPLRQVSGQLFNVLLRSLGLTRLADTQCGLKAFTAKAAAALFRDLSINRFAFDVEVLLRAELLGMVIRELPIEWKHVEASRVRPVKDSSRMISDVMRLRRRLRRGMTATAGRSMSRAKLDVTAKVESHHWWFRAKRELLVQELRKAGATGKLAVDAGCGTGEVVRALNGLPFETVLGSDVSEYALELVRKEADLPSPLLASEAEALPLRTGVATCLVSLDVVEHLDDDVAALREFGRVVSPGGTIVVAVPAYAWAWSDHDVVLGHRRRYTRRSLLEVAAASGVVVERCTYYHSWLVPIALLVRRTPLRRLVRNEAEEASFVNPTVNRLLTAVAAVERRVCRFVDLPFGLSIMMVARTSEARDRTVPGDARSGVATSGTS